MTISFPKTKMLFQPWATYDYGIKRERERGETLSLCENERCEVMFDDVDDFVYLGTKLVTDLRNESDVNRRISLVMMVFRKLKNKVFCRKGISRRTKVIVYKAMVLANLLHGAQTWTLTEDLFRKLEKTQLSCLLWIVNMRRRDLRRVHVSYEKILEQLGLRSIETQIRRAKLLWVGKVMRMDDSRLPKQLFCGILHPERGVPSQWGRQKHYMECIKDDLQKFSIVREGWWQRAQIAANWVEEVENGADACERVWRVRKE
jgi:hypothetical protein